MKKFYTIILLAVGGLFSTHAAIPDGGWSATPKNGSTVTQITEITVSKQNEHYMDPYVNRSVKVNGESIAITQKVTNNGGTMVMTLATPVEKSGVYEIVVPERTFTYGYSMFTDEEDNPEISWTVTVDNPDFPIEPDIPDVTILAEPASGTTVKSLDNITIAFEGASTAIATTDFQATVGSLGTPVETTISTVAGTEPNQIVMNLTPAIILSGEYTITVAAGSFDLTSAEGATFQNEEFKLNYTLKAPPAVGDRFVVDKIRYKVLSRDPMSVAVTFPDNEADYSTLTTVPTSVTYDDEVFAVTEIGDLSFSEVAGMEEFTVPEGITRIGTGAFWESSIPSINIAATVTELGESAFESCKSLTSFTLPSTVTTIGDDLLCDCSSLKEVILPDNLTAIPNGFVQGCVLLERLDVPSSVTRIGEFAMSECALLTQTNIPDGVTDIDKFAYAYCTALEQLPVPESVTTMGHGVFYQAGLTEASLPQNLTTIPDGTFQCCASLKEFTIGPNITDIEKEAFFWCFALEKITFGEKVATIGTKAFEKDEALKEIICQNPVPATGATFPQAVYDNAVLTVPDGSIEAYRNAPGWKEFKSITNPLGVSESITDEIRTYFTGNTLHIISDKEVNLYDMRGRILYSGKTGEITLKEQGIYLLSSEGKTTKLVH